MKVSGFGYCTLLGHKNVGIYKDANERYYVQIDYYRSNKTFDNLKNLDGLWACLVEVGQYLAEAQGLHDRFESKIGRGGSICPEPPL